MRIYDDFKSKNKTQGKMYILNSTGVLWLKVEATNTQRLNPYFREEMQISIQEYSFIESNTK